MIHGRTDGMVAGFKPAANGHIQGIGTIERENKMIGAFPMKKRVEAVATKGDDIGGFSGFRVAAAAGRGTDSPGVIHHSVEHFGRFWKTGGGVVGINAVGGLNLFLHAGNILSQPDCDPGRRAGPAATGIL